MNAQAILDQILADAKENASAILNDANDRAAQMRKASEKKIAEARAAAASQAEADAVVDKQRMERMAELDERKRILSDKRALIDRAFEGALARMKAMPAAQARSYLLDVVVSVAGGTEKVIVGAENDSWFDDSFVASANEALSAQGKPGRLTLETGRKSGVSGLILAQRDTEINCTYDALLSSRRLEMEAEVAQVLFPAT